MTLSVSNEQLKHMGALFSNSASAMNFTACIVKSAGSKVSANDLMYSLIILDKSHGKIHKAILSPPLTTAWFEDFK